MCTLFACETCNTVDSLELTPHVPGEPYQCAACRGEWHGQFPKAPYDPAKDTVVNRGSGVGLS